MSLQLPPAEPPAPEVDQVLQLLATARQELADARDKEQRADQLAAYAGGTELHSMQTRVLQRTRAFTTSCWRAEVTHLEHVARNMGLQP